VNRFAYCRGSPVALRDTDGLAAKPGDESLLDVDGRLVPPEVSPEVLQAGIDEVAAELYPPERKAQVGAAIVNGVVLSAVESVLLVMTLADPEGAERSEEARDALRPYPGAASLPEEQAIELLAGAVAAAIGGRGAATAARLLRLSRSGTRSLRGVLDEGLELALDRAPALLDDLAPSVRAGRSAFLQLGPAKTAAQVRASAGTAFGTDLPDIRAKWLRGGVEGRVPGQVARELSGRRFRNFDAFREAFWQAVASDADLAAQFSKINRARMAAGKAPFVRLGQSVGNLRKFVIHHIELIADGGGVYDMLNLRITTPRRHQMFHAGK